MLVFQNIILLEKTANQEGRPIITRLIDYLGQRGATIYCECSSSIQQASVKRLALTEIGNHCDLAIVVGGDGTLLRAARILSDFDIPVLGIAADHLGFLMDISPINFPAELDSILAGIHCEEARFLFAASIVRDGVTINQATAFNDVVLHKWNVPRMVEIETYIDGHFVNRQRSDGLIAATPTGSTAYALSGGGPLIYPTLNAMLLTPICPHTLTNRPIVVNADSVIQFILIESNSASARVIFDGHHSLNLLDNDVIIVRKKSRKIRILHPREHDYYEVLRAKLKWSEHIVSST